MCFKEVLDVTLQKYVFQLISWPLNDTHWKKKYVDFKIIPQTGSSSWLQINDANNINHHVFSRQESKIVFLTCNIKIKDEKTGVLVYFLFLYYFH